MPCICICTDIPETESLRQQHLAAHFLHIEENLEKIAIAGPLKVTADKQPHGSIFIYHTDDPDEALELTRKDPYYIAGIWKEISCEHFIPAAGSWIGGTIW
jgi:uncharacterized protein YciI